MVEKIKITAVSYLNTKPLLYGLFKSELAEHIDLQLDIPSVCAQKLASKEVDLGLVPVAVIPELETPHIISDFCIGSDGAVKTVAVFSEVPIESVSEIYLDYQSRTSVELLKIILRKYYKLSPDLLPSTAGFQNKIKGTTAALVIGDHAIGLEKKHKYSYDLSAIWKSFTGLPFAFAAWVSHQPLDPTFVKKFNQALQAGIEDIPQLIYLLPSPSKDFDLKSYFQNNISYHFDDEKKKALKIFLNEISTELQPSLSPVLDVA